MGNIISKLVPGDVVHIAGGTYLGRGKCGTNIITVPVSIIGGYSDDFSKRDPWGAHKTIFSGDNGSDNWKREPALMIDLMKYKGKEMPAILVDGIIVDHAARNRYSDEKQLSIVRTANPKKKENPTPDQGGLVIRVSKTGNFQDSWKVTVQNCIVMNTAPTQGALSVSGYKGTKATVRNNLVINNTGTGIFLGSKYRPADGKNIPEFLVENNTVLFTWKFDAAAQSYSGNSIKFDPDTLPVVKNNVFAFADRYGVNNGSKATVLFDLNIGLDDIEDEAEFIHEDSEENVAEKIQVPVAKEWSTHYGSRVLIDRNAVEADVKVQKSRANEIRAMLGLPLLGENLDVPQSPAWLNRLTIEDAVKAGTSPYSGKGCSLPKAS